GSAALGLMAAMSLAAARNLLASPTPAATPGLVPLQPPAQGSIPVAFLLSAGAVVIDFCGPWEVFQDVVVPSRRDAPFRLYTVAESTKPLQASAGMTIVPDYTLATAPAPKVIVIPAQHEHTPAMIDWIRKSAAGADLTMSVCTGAFLLARTGLLAGKPATTHHSSYQTLAMQFPDIRVQRGARFVDNGNLASAGGLSSGIDLALRVVERYFGREIAQQTATYMEYQGQGWLHPESNAIYAAARISTDEHPLCPVCQMDTDKATGPRSVYQGKTYYFCSQEHKELFDQAPAGYLVAGAKR
ncbi:MAG TPA: DJ-1/PfpI family protein, partial [Thermoanaerobaculia bacterium]|nr:DJ-1/PfpI family protein [Thermoanaerobaculia bacterium]